MDSNRALTIYQDQDAVSLELPQENGSLLIVDMPGPAEQDAAFLTTWLFGNSEKTQKAYTSDMSKFYATVGKSLQDVRLEDFQAFINSLVSLKPASRSRAIASVKSALSFGQKTGYLPVNVGTVVKLPKLEDTLAERIMSEQSIARMFALETNTRNHAILVLLYRAGLRVSELCNLTWRNLQERDQAGQIAVFGKGKKTRFVLLDESTWLEVMSLKTGEASPVDYVFQSRQTRSRGSKDSRRIDPSRIHQIVLAAAKRAGLAGNVSPHWFRHAHATHSLEHGAPITLVKDTLGHKSMETTARYTHVRPNTSSTTFLKV
jgi:integrase/recombinase XerD